MIRKAMAYVDGFNLYFGLKDMGWRCYYWLDIKALCKKFAKPPYCQLEGVKYFTSRIKGDPNKVARQDAYIQAFKTVSKIDILWGEYGKRSYKCHNCRHKGELPTEKMTDVCLASEMLLDASQNKYKIAYLISGDKDLVPVIKLIKDTFPDRTIILIPPPQRYCSDLANVADITLNMWEYYLRKSQFPSTITRPGLSTLTRPASWV